MTDVENSITRIKEVKGVVALCAHIRTTIDRPTTLQYAASVCPLTTKARNCIKEVDPRNELQFLRVGSKKHEILVAWDPNYTLIVIQDPSPEGHWVL